MSDFFKDEFELFDEQFDMFGIIETDREIEVRPASVGNGHIETWIREDGSLTPRRKGDIYWKKVKALILGGATLNAHYVDKQKAIYFANIFLEYEKLKGRAEADELDGTEFKFFPMTTAGRDIAGAGILRAMRAKDVLAEQPEKKELADSLSKVLSLYFAVAGIDENTGRPIEANPNLIGELNDAKKRYEELFEWSGYNFKDTPAYKKRGITSEDYEKYSEYLPEYYVTQLVIDSLYADVYTDEEDGMTAVVIYAIHRIWKELVWISIDEEHRDNDTVTSLISHIVKEAVESGLFGGLFMELHMDSKATYPEDVFNSIGVSTYRQKNNVYEFVFSDIVPDKAINAATRKASCVSVDFLDDWEKAQIEEIIRANSQPVPIGFPIDWDYYRGDLSFAYVNAEYNTAGLMLVSEIGDSLVLELLYGTNSIIVAALLGTAIQNGGGYLPDDKKIVVAIINESTSSLIRRLVPNAKRGEIVQAVTWF